MMLICNNHTLLASYSILGIFKCSVFLQVYLVTMTTNNTNIYKIAQWMKNCNFDFFKTITLSIALTKYFICYHLLLNEFKLVPGLDTFRLKWTFPFWPVHFSVILKCPFSASTLYWSIKNILQVLFC